MDWQERYRSKLITAEQAAKLIASHSDVLFPVFDHPSDIGMALSKRFKELEDVTLTAHWTEDYPFLHPDKYPELAKAFSVKDPMTLRNTREGIKQKTIDWKPTSFGLSDGQRQTCPDRGRLYHSKDFFIFKLTNPNNADYCSFGPHHWYTPTACRTARVKIAEIDPKLAWVYGEYVNLDDIDYIVEVPASVEARASGTIVPLPTPEEWEVSQVIGANAASLIKDGDTVEIGTGTASEAVMDFLKEKNDIGIDSELIYPQIVELVKSGNITGKNKSLDAGKVVSSSMAAQPGNPAVKSALDFVTMNPAFEFRDISTMCHVPRIASQENLIAINNILAIDLLGQAVITHIGSNPISGPGGQIDYCVGAHYARGGRSIAMLNATASAGKASRIVPSFEAGAVVMLPMVYLDYLVTEYGIVNLDCKSRRERAEALISVAHPDFRPELIKRAREMFYP